MLTITWAVGLKKKKGACQVRFVGPGQRLYIILHNGTLKEAFRCFFVLHQYYNNVGANSIRALNPQTLFPCHLSVFVGYKGEVGREGQKTLIYIFYAIQIERQGDCADG